MSRQQKSMRHPEYDRAILGTVLPGDAGAGRTSVSNRFSNPKTMPAPRGYTQVVETTGPGRTVYLSGQLGMTPGGDFAGNDFRAQATQCFENLKAGLASVGAGFEHVVKITNFFTDMSHLPVFFEVRDSFVNTKAPPASTAIQVGRLAREGALFEVEAVAVIPDKAAKAKRAAAKPARKVARKKRR
jgi:enamine deaminase RidA (YjgF/YER057c/UK114 family)